MKNINVFNKILIFIAVIFIGLIIHKIIFYRGWDRYYYVSSVSSPKEFPIRIVYITFIPEELNRLFIKSTDQINEFESEWGLNDYYEPDEPLFLPESLYLEYVDYRTGKFYLDTIPLPKEKIEEIFIYAGKHNHLENLDYRSFSKRGLIFHVGIANDGNIIFWLIGNEFEKEFYRIRLNPKSFSEYAKRTEQPAKDKETYFNALFEELEDTIKQQIRDEGDINIQYKDSIPWYFEYLKENE